MSSHFAQTPMNYAIMPIRAIASGRVLPRTSLELSLDRLRNSPYYPCTAGRTQPFEGDSHMKSGRILALATLSCLVLSIGFLGAGTSSEKSVSVGDFAVMIASRINP